jgi:rhomboid family GlyGly-CTERM serine protease
MGVFRVSSAEQVAVGVAAVVMVLVATADAEQWEYRRELLASEPWRLLSGHLVHINWQHAVINAVALLIVARLFSPDLRAARQGIVLGTCALAISFGLALLYPTIGWYRGLSGVVHGLFFAGAAAWLVKAQPRTLRTLWLPLALLAGGWIKVLLEQPAGDALPYADWLGAAVVPQAHLIGAACGTALGLASALADRRYDAQRAEQQQLQRR